LLINGTNILNLDFINNYGIINGQDYRLDDNGTDRPNIFTSNIQFSRTSSATYFDNTGVMRVTPASKNLYTWSQDFENSAWTKSGCSVAANQNPFQATLGPELVTNGDFSNGATGWVLGTGWSVSDGVASKVAGTGSSISRNFGAVAGRTYQVTITVTRSAGFAFIRIGSVTDNTVGISSTGTFTRFVVAGTLDANFYFFGDSAFVGTIDNISIREAIDAYNIAPDNTPTADTMIASAGVTSPQIQQTVTTVAGTLYTASFYVRAFDWQFVQLAVNNQTGEFCNFNLTGTGTVQNNGAAVGSITFDINTGYYRISMTYAASGSDSRPILAMVPSATATRLQTRTWAGAEFNTIWGAQFEVVESQNLVFGPELVTNGDFAVDANWSKGVGWTIAGGVASYVGTGVAAGINQIISLVPGRTYEITGVATITSGSVIPRLTGGTTVTGPTITTSGAFKAYLTAVTGNTDIQIFSGVSASVTIDNISVREITSILNMPTTYTSNYAGTFPPRFDYNPVTLQPQGLLIEEQRTNLLVRSEEFDIFSGAWGRTRVLVTPNLTTSPDGTLDADKLIADTSENTTHLLAQNVTIVGNTTYTYTVYAKAAEYTSIRLSLAQGGGNPAVVVDANLITGVGTQTRIGTGWTSPSSAVVPVGNGWYRISVTGTSPSITNGSCWVQLINPNVAFTGDGTSGVFIWGAQLEAGDFATSYIPTVASQVTRTADIAQISFPIFNQFYNQTEGTFVAEATTSFKAATTSPSVFTVSDITVNNRVRCFAADTSHLVVTTRRLTQCDIDAGNITDNTVFKVSTAMKTDSFAASLNGGSVVTDISGTLPDTMTQLNIGAAQTATTNFLNGYIRRLIYIPLRLPNNQLQALTQ
jgi:hypothetical protein